MSKESTQEANKLRPPFSARLSIHTWGQLREIERVHGLTHTQTVTLAVDRLAADLLAPDAELPPNLPA